ncbi:DVU0298 family protein [Moorella sulfitireducens (nom. illeg.)]|uniref:DVU0298 family protein n=1 Tax=Neomoorella sulfitireducens TaxID=2972948 RepID=UPI0021AD4186|nr:DVU0298 family protein [Moorella sulfitireducens]
MKKELAFKPVCPFCGLLIARPGEHDVRRPKEMPVGTCSCGAVYACDLTGHNLGAAFIEALVSSCNMDWDLAWGLLPEEDYVEKLVENYDYETHLIIPGGVYEGRRISGALYFVKLHPDILEFTLQGGQKKPLRASTAPSPALMASPDKRKFTKKDIETLVREYQVEALLEIAASDRRLIRDLQRLLYSGDELLRLRAADFLGKTAAVIAKKSPQTIANLLQRLLASVTEPGSSGWGAIDAAGFIIACIPETFAGYIPSLYQLLAETTFKKRALHAIGRIARVKPDLIRPASLRFLKFLHDPDPEIRGYTAWILGNLGTTAARDMLAGLLEDGQPVTLYENGTLHKKTVGQLASEALARM